MNSPTNKILGISGSPRKNGNSDALLAAITEGIAQTSVPVTPTALRDLDFGACIGCERCRRDKICTGLTDGMTNLYPEIESSRGLVLISPAHNYNITALMKAFIDRLYCFYNFENSVPRAWSSRLAGQDRKAVVLGVCEQESAEDMGFTLDAMALPLTALGYEVIHKVPVLRVFSRGKVKEDAELMERIAVIGKTLGESLYRNPAIH